MPERTYNTHDGVVNTGTFGRWMMSAPGVKTVLSETYSDLSSRAIYAFKDAIVRIDESGSWRDGAPVSIRVESDTEETLEEICCKLEPRFFGRRL